MKTLKLRIVVTFTLALIGSSLAMLWVSASIAHRFTIEFFEGSMKLQLQQAQKIYEGGGPGGRSLNWKAVPYRRRRT